MAFQAHLESNFFLVFVDDGYRQPEANNNEIDGRARCGERRNPPSLTTALISDPGTACTGNPPWFLAWQPRRHLPVYRNPACICLRTRRFRVYHRRTHQYSWPAAVAVARRSCVQIPFPHRERE